MTVLTLHSHIIFMNYVDCTAGEKRNLIYKLNKFTTLALNKLVLQF